MDREEANLNILSPDGRRHTRTEPVFIVPSRTSFGGTKNILTKIAQVNSLFRLTLPYFEAQRLSVQFKAICHGRVIELSNVQ